MPIASKAQMRLVYAAASKKGGVGGMSQDVAKEFVAAGPAKKDLPERKDGKRALYARKD